MIKLFGMRREEIVEENRFWNDADTAVSWPVNVNV